MSVSKPLIWKIHLAAQQPAKAAAVLGIIALALAGLLLVLWPWPGQMLLLFALAVFLLAGSVAEYILPVTYTLDADGAHMRYLGNHRIIPWERVRRVYLRPDGLKLSPLAERSWVDSFRGVQLRTKDRASVLSAVRAWLTDRGVSPEFIEESA